MKKFFKLASIAFLELVVSFSLVFFNIALLDNFFILPILIPFLFFICYKLIFKDYFSVTTRDFIVSGTFFYFLIILFLLNIGLFMSGSFSLGGSSQYFSE